MKDTKSRTGPKTSDRDSQELTGDFAQSLKLLKEASGLTWAEIARLLGTSVVNLGGGGRGVGPIPTIPWLYRRWSTVQAWAACSQLQETADKFENTKRYRYA